MRCARWRRWQTRSEFAKSLHDSRTATQILRDWFPAETRQHGSVNARNLEQEPMEQDGRLE
jgi:hypothetical protein